MCHFSRSTESGKKTNDTCTDILKNTQQKEFNKNVNGRSISFWKGGVSLEVYEEKTAVYIKTCA